MRILEVQREHAKWATKNFGYNFCQSWPIRPVTHIVTGAPGANLNSLCAVLGMVEEFGEFITASIAGDVDETRDAIGDIGIYFLDFVSREGFSEPLAAGFAPFLLPEDARLLTVRTAADHVVISLGRLNHVVLKRLQGIRGLDSLVNYRGAALNALANIYAGMVRLAAIHCPPAPGDAGRNAFESQIIRTWEKIVSKRNWNADAKTGASPITAPTENKGGTNPPDEMGQRPAAPMGSHVVDSTTMRNADVRTKLKVDGDAIAAMEDAVRRGSADLEPRDHKSPATHSSGLTPIQLVVLRQAAGIAGAHIPHGVDASTIVDELVALGLIRKVYMDDQPTTELTSYGAQVLAVSDHQ